MGLCPVALVDFSTVSQLDSNCKTRRASTCLITDCRIQFVAVQGKMYFFLMFGALSNKIIIGRKLL